ncbi:flagellar basal-body MS-ring/collar protein FliF [Brevibacillus fulvus]|uniref:Flagellar M-ring protein n=1 Tax=Brevibacillus fulvus TaxID=1125967 RepID=A0A939BUN5_9BACL|nr:flagellar basal-body MS-ring/collar protein FliF [Brevibacillus fulvus]MBM7590629.1 flagellar M-ring protein FliF [Brevibacillus fulvus]
MNERLLLYRDKLKEKWSGLSNKQRWMLIGASLFLLIALGLYIYISAQPVYKPLYNQGLTPKEVGEIKAELDKQQIPNRITQNGTSIEVPEAMAQDVIVDLAAQGIPSEAGINMELFGSNNLGMTDRQFAVMKKDALQQEVAKMLGKVDGVREAQVMISLPEENALGITSDPEQATASVIVNVEPGTRLNQEQIKALYYLVSRSVPKLPLENITITNQFSEMLTLDEQGGANGSLGTFEDQERIKKEAQESIQQNLYNLLGTIMGRDKVIVHTSVQMDFSQENRVENLVEAPDKENNEGLIISSQKLSETYSGQGAPPGGAAGTGQNDVASFPGTTSQGTQSDYEKINDVVNREVNRITRNITMSPYKIEDISINVGVEPPDGGQLDQQTLDNIRQVLRNVVRVTLSEKGVELTQQQLDDRIMVFPRTFSGKVADTTATNLNPWIYGAGALALLAIGTVAFLVYRRRRQAKQVAEEVPDLPQPQPFEVPELEITPDGDEYVVRKQLEKLARSKPDEFVVLLRTWLAED